MYVLIQHTYPNTHTYSINTPQDSRVLATTMSRQAAIELFVDERDKSVYHNRFSFGGCDLEHMFFSYRDGLIYKVMVKHVN